MSLQQRTAEDIKKLSEQIKASFFAYLTRDFLELITCHSLCLQENPAGAHFGMKLLLVKICLILEGI